MSEITSLAQVSTDYLDQCQYHIIIYYIIYKQYSFIVIILCNDIFLLWGLVYSYISMSNSVIDYSIQRYNVHYSGKDQYFISVNQGEV